MATVVFYQPFRQEGSQSPPHLPDEGGGDQVRLGETKFQRHRVEHRVTPLQGFLSDVFLGFFGVVRRDLVSVKAD